jgi:hypothetical protein
MNHLPVALIVYLQYECHLVMLFIPSAINETVGTAIIGRGI